MKLPHIVTTLDYVPGQYRDLYERRGGEFHLTAAAPDSPAAPKMSPIDRITLAREGRLS